jgi:hypothetical protein
VDGILLSPNFAIRPVFVILRGEPEASASETPPVADARGSPEFALHSTAGSWYFGIASGTKSLSFPDPPRRSPLLKQTGATRFVMVPIAPGELIDKITILQIKEERVRDEGKLVNIRRELAELQAVHVAAVPSSPGLEQLTAGLKEVNERLWDIEDNIRDCERSKDFGTKFIELARSVYFQNDRRAKLKRDINELLGSEIVEEKSYQAY